jgi:hypothetical protein
MEGKKRKDYGNKGAEAGGASININEDRLGEKII